MKQELTFRIIGMHCASCSVSIEKALRALPGVQSVVVNYANEEAFIVFDPAQLEQSTIQKVVADLGYKAVLAEFAESAGQEQSIEELEQKVLLASVKNAGDDPKKQHSAVKSLVDTFY